MIRPVVAVDLAARFTAGVSLGPRGEIVSQWDSGEMTHRQVVDRIYDDFVVLTLESVWPIVVIEDIPPRNMPSLRAVLQLQGRIIQKFSEVEALAHVYFVQPSTWQRAMGVWRVSPDLAAAMAAGRFGYSAPDLVELRGLTRGQRGVGTLIREADKQRTDYVDAFLIAQWARASMALDRVWDSGQVRQYSE